MNNLKLINFNNTYKTYLNTWQAKEKELGQMGFNNFIVLDGYALGDYLGFINDEMNDIFCNLAIQDEQLAGFICFSRPEKNHIHIEMLGVNPEMRGQKLSNKILALFKESVKTKNVRISFSVNRQNKAGLSSFSKLGKFAQNQTKANYIDFEL